MENAAKALSIAGGILIALIILAGLIYTFQKMSEIPDRQNYIKEVQEIEEFNRQFEAYQKKLMYGVDVISCLNKVIDNNTKSEEYENGIYNVEIKITIKSNIEDKIEVWKFDDKGKERIDTEDRDIGTFSKIFGDSFSTSLVSNIKGSTQVNSRTDYCWLKINKEVTYTYFKNEDIEKDKNASVLKALSDATVDMQKVATNPNKDDIKNWSKVVWYTSAYNFKNKKFRCTNISYSTEGRVNKISFEEVLNNN